jgi:DNA adenine methylase
MTMIGELSPALKWPGGKTWMLPRLRELYGRHRHRTLVEPFVGSMAVALGLRPDRARLSDVNVQLVNFHQRLRIPYPFEIHMEYDETLYYKYRDCFNELIKGPAALTDTTAELFYYLNRTGFNGLCRFSKTGNFNVPFGRYEKVTYRRDFSEYADALSRWEIYCTDMEHARVESGDFVYLDPPYDGTFTDYSAGGFSWGQQVWLATYFAAHDGPVVASNQATDRILSLYRGLGYTVETVEVPRTMSSNGDRQTATEMIATKNA